MTKTSAGSKSSMKESIRKHALRLAIDDVGFAAVSDYNSPRTKKIEEIFPGAKNPQIAMNGRLDIMEFARHCTFSLARYVETKCSGRAMSMPLSYPLEMDPAGGMGVLADVSFRHAAVAAGLGSFGRNNLVVHPRLGSRILFCGIITDLAIQSDPPCETNPCTNCNLCVKSCPAEALEKEGYTDVFKCLKKSQPYGLAKSISFWNKFIKNTPEEQAKMFFTKDYWQMYQTQFIGFQYFCFKCFSTCPVGNKKNKKIG
jgi:ferredoxin